MEWISVLDNLPVPENGQLCSYDVLIAYHSKWVRVGYLNGYKEWHAYILNSNDDITEKVYPTHWMNFPEPPEVK